MTRDQDITAIRKGIWAAAIPVPLTSRDHTLPQLTIRAVREPGEPGGSQILLQRGNGSAAKHD